MQSWTNTKIPPNESKFYRHKRHIFSNTGKNCNVPDFSICLASCRVQTRAEITQNSEVFASKLEDASPAAIFVALNQNFIVQLCCVQSLVGKGYF